MSRRLAFELDERLAAQLGLDDKEPDQPPNWKAMAKRRDDRGQSSYGARRVDGGESLYTLAVVWSPNACGADPEPSPKQGAKSRA